MCGWQVKLCDSLVTRGPYLSVLEIRSLYIKRYINSPSLLYFTDILLSTLFSYDNGRGGRTGKKGKGGGQV